MPYDNYEPTQASSGLPLVHFVEQKVKIEQPARFCGLALQATSWVKPTFALIQHGLGFNELVGQGLQAPHLRERKAGVAVLQREQSPPTRPFFCSNSLQANAYMCFANADKKY